MGCWDVGVLFGKVVIESGFGCIKTWGVVGGAVSLFRELLIERGLNINLIYNGKIGVYMSYLKYRFGCKANKCSRFLSKKWQWGLAIFGNGDIISALARPPKLTLDADLVSFRTCL